MAQVRLDADVEADVRAVAIDGSSLAQTANELLREALAARGAITSPAPRQASASVSAMRHRVPRRHAG